MSGQRFQLYHVWRDKPPSTREKQIISFARILLRNPRILVLDEATANIDTQTEVQIKEALKVVSKNRTTFVIAHRLSTIKEANRIVVIDKGIVEAVGKHEELLSKSKKYQEMYYAQLT